MKRQYSKKGSSKRRYMIGILALGFACLVGCGRHAKKPYHVVDNPKLTYAQQRKLLSTDLTNQGVQILKYGQVVRMVIPADFVFLPNSANLHKKKTFFFTDIANYISCFHKVSVTVSVYGDTRGIQSRSKDISKERAQKIIQELWKKGINARLLIGYGRGNANPVDNIYTKKGRFKNRRIEITFHYRIHNQFLI